jgi:ABC-type sugar transport system substrate-binding protein
MTGLTTGTIQLTVAQEPSVQGANAVDQAVAVAVSAAAALSASLSGCGTADAGVTAVSADTTIEMITGTQNSSFYLSTECGAAVEARKLGLNLTVVGPQENTAAAQLPLVQGVIVGNPDALIISPAAGAAS